MNQLKPYPAYRQTGLRWLEAIPSHWGVVQSRRLFSQRRDRAAESDQQLTASQRHGIVYQADYMVREGTRVVQVIKGAEILKLVEPNDFVISMRSFQGGIEWSGLRGSISSAYVMLVPSAKVHAPYFRYLLKSAPYIQALQSTSDLVRDGQALRFENFTLVDLPLVPAAEQVAIARFLDRETARIDALIDKKTRFIELLREKRQALITQAVTRGLDPTGPMKDSGIDWLGLIPAHWSTSPLKYLVRFASGGTPSKERLEYWNGVVPWASAKDLKVDLLSDTEDHITELAVDDCAASLIPSGSVLVVVRGMILARTFPVTTAGVPMAINQDLKAVIAGPRLDGSFLAHLLRGTSQLSLARLEEAAHGTKALRMETWVDLKLPVPPLNEQAEIVRQLERQLDSFDLLDKRISASLGLLRERRAALITAAVTGQVEVREAA